MRSICIRLAVYFIGALAAARLVRTCRRTWERTLFARDRVCDRSFPGRSPACLAHDVPGIYDRLYAPLEEHNRRRVDGQYFCFDSRDRSGGPYSPEQPVIYPDL